MGQRQSRFESDSPEVRTIQEIANANGPCAVQTYLNETLNKWKNEPVKFGIIGRTSTGKSTFINAIRDLQFGDNGFADVGRGNITRSPTVYSHPANAHIVFVDLPGYGPEEFPSEKYVEIMKICEYDYLFFFFDTVLLVEDLRAMRHILESGKPFSLVRSKVDKDVKDGKRRGKKEEEVIELLRENIRTVLNSNGEFKHHVATFLISGKKPSIGEMDKLNKHILEELLSTNEEKYKAVVFSFGPLSKHVIEEKYKSLKKRAIAVTAATASISAIPVPGLDLVINMGILVNEIKHYIKVFGLSSTQMESLQNFDYNKLKCKGILSKNLTLKDTTKLIGQQLGKLLATVTLVTLESVLDILLPFVGSIISSATTAGLVYKFLNGYLDDLRDDAVLVYDHIKPKN